MIHFPRGVFQTRLQIARFERRHFFENLRRGQPGFEKVEHVRNANPHIADTRLAAALFGLCRNASEKTLGLFHARYTNICRIWRR